MFIRAYLRASTSEQDANRAKSSLKKFVSGFSKRIASFYIENKSGNSLDRPVSLDLPTSHLTFGSFPSDDFMRSILSAINNMLLEILAASAYKEYRERERKQKEGIVKAQQKGLYHGRQPDLEAHDRIASFTEAGFSINKTAEAVGVSRSTVIRVRKKLKNLD